MQTSDASFAGFSCDFVHGNITLNHFALFAPIEMPARKWLACLFAKLNDKVGVMILLPVDQSIRQNYAQMNLPVTNDVSAVTIPDHYTTIEAARLLGMAVRSVQLMVDRGELQAWKTPGGHRRIARESVERWLAGQAAGSNPDAIAATQAPSGEDARPPGRDAMEARSDKGGTGKLKVLLIEDSAHFQKLVGLLVQQRFPGIELRVADDGIAGLAMYGQWQPDVLIVDILLPGIDGAALITSLRTHEQFRDCRLIVVTSLAEADRAPYAFALQGVPLVHKPRLVADLPPLLEASFEARARAPG